MKEDELKKTAEEQAAAEETEAAQTAASDEANAEAPETAAEAEDTENTETASDTAETAPEESGDPKQTAEVAELKDKYLRLYAEFDNFRKRSEKEKLQNFDFGAREVIEKLLPVVDNFERALGTAAPEEEEDAFTKGVRGIYKQLQKLFEDLDVKVIPAEGEKFDPNLHNAVMTDTESDAEEDTITKDLQKGYTFRGQVVRHSMVKVKK